LTDFPRDFSPSPFVFSDTLNLFFFQISCTIIRPLPVPDPFPRAISSYPKFATTFLSCLWAFLFFSIRLFFSKKTFFYSPPPTMFHPKWTKSVENGIVVRGIRLAPIPPTYFFSILLAAASAGSTFVLWAPPPLHFVIPFGLRSFGFGEPFCLAPRGLFTCLSLFTVPELTF